MRRPLSGVLGVYLFFPFGLGPPPGWNDKCVRAISTAARSHFPSMRIVDLAGDIHLTDASAGRNELAVGMAGLMSPLGEIGVRFRAKEGQR